MLRIKIMARAFFKPFTLSSAPYVTRQTRAVPVILVQTMGWKLSAQRKKSVPGHPGGGPDQAHPGTLRSPCRTARLHKDSALTRSVDRYLVISSNCL